MIDKTRSRKNGFKKGFTSSHKVVGLQNKWYNFWKARGYVWILLVLCKKDELSKQKKIILDNDKIVVWM